MAAIAHVLVVCSNMGSCQAAPIVPSMRDLRAFTKAPRITRLSFQSFQLQGAAFFILRGCILTGSDLCLLSKLMLLPTSEARIKPIFQELGCSPYQILNHQDSEHLSFSEDQFNILVGYRCQRYKLFVFHSDLLCFNWTSIPLDWTCHLQFTSPTILYYLSPTSLICCYLARLGGMGE